MRRVCQLSYRCSIDIIKDTEKVYFRSGVWNEYELVDTQYTIERIKNSGYGADVYLNEENGMYYVSCPCSSDMW